ncbi:hydrogen gas-evolving membrane-bound hydrogenase subunit E [Amycolatopsis pigmentata]|uniref:Hydrogen gas-evolving membrane-bound hydrogenase subunit E n=1 Tax=Amycolatopsis pigmentata TaxID=450801 RepID=A0ABW5G1P9_9PSEU
MNRRFRTVLALAGAAGIAALLCAAFLRTPGAAHVYSDLAVPIAQARSTQNVVSSVNFDLRALDTLGEETIVVAAVVGTLSLLAPSRATRRQIEQPVRPVLPSVKFTGYLLLPVTVVLGAIVVLHGHLTPGGGFQGGVALATGWHLLYLAGDYPALDRLRPIDWCEYVDAAATGLYVVTGLIGLGLAGSFLANFLPSGTFGSLLSAGIVPVLSFFVGVEVAAGLLVLLAQFLEQAMVRSGDGA